MKSSSVLFAQPSFLRGMASAFDIGNTLSMYNTSNSDMEADTEALHHDWVMVGDDIIFAISQMEEDLNKR